MAVNLGICSHQEFYALMKHAQLGEEFTVMVRKPCGGLALAQLFVQNPHRYDGQWEISIRTNGVWVPGLLHPESHNIVAFAEEMHFD